MHILDVAQNSLDAGATRIEIVIVEDLPSDKLTIRITDNGRGMSQDIVAKVLDPFYTTRTTRRVGLGLPLFAAAAQDCDGDLKIESTEGQGTTVVATFQHSHIDRAPLGDMKSTLMSIIMSEHPCDLHYVHQLHSLAQGKMDCRGGTHPANRHPEKRELREAKLCSQDVQPKRAFEFNTADIKRELACPPLFPPACGGMEGEGINIPLSHPAVREWLAEFITEGEASLQA